MDPDVAHWYHIQFQAHVVTKRGSEFQGGFVRIMELAYPGDFVAVRPHGRDGDHKCDGYLRSGPTVFQVYAPAASLRDRLREAMAKIRADFAGARRQWPGLRRWILVHNDQEGLPAQIVQQLEVLQVEHPDLQISVWSPTDLEQQVLAIAPQQLALLFPPPPQMRDFLDLGYSDVAPLLAALELASSDPRLEEIRPVSVKKLERNALSPENAHLLALGRRRERLIEEMLNRYPDPTYGEDLANAFRGQYRQCRALGLTPDAIFEQLYARASAGQRHTTPNQAGALAILAYFFERCDIFEPADEEPRP